MLFNSFERFRVSGVFTILKSMHFRSARLARALFARSQGAVKQAADGSCCRHTIQQQITQNEPAVGRLGRRCGMSNSSERNH